MNEYDLNVPPPSAVLDPVPPLSPKPRPLSWWLRKFFACNPFYLVSAALLLYGCYRVSIDAPFLSLESVRLVFNFSSVQAYEILLVLVAIFLARRRLWYDSMVLVGLENLLVFVPFILISQASLTGPQMTQAVCATGVTLAVLRFSSLKTYFTQLNLPARLLGLGAALLAVNVALPLVYRHYIDFKLGDHLDSGPDYVMNECNWLLVLPAVLALANFLPRAQTSGDLLPQHRWLPAGIFALWFAVTGVHLYSLDYVYGYYLRNELFAPLAVVFAWTVFLQCPAGARQWKYALMVPALLAPLLAASAGNPRTFLVLTTLNVAGYATVSVLNRGNRLAPHLAYASLLLFISGVPDGWLESMAPWISKQQCIGAGLAGYVIFWTAWLRNPALAIVGSVIFSNAVTSVFGGRPGVEDWAMQGAFVFLILHSLRWRKNHSANTWIRYFVLAGWVMESFVWMNSDFGRFWMPLISAGVVLVVYCVCLPGRGIWRLAAVPAAAMLVILSGPCSGMFDTMRSTPMGLLAVIGSFLLLGAGTVAALTRDLWHKHEPAPEKNETPDSAFSSTV